MTARNAGLDSLRFAAVLLVIGRHLSALPGDLPASINWLSQLWINGGWVGVDLFFVLSGFLIASLLISEYQDTGRVAAGRFLLRRGFKIYPPFLALIAATCLLPVDQPLDGRRVAAELLFVQNYFAGLWNHTWSLAVEEHFYLGFAALMAFLTRGSTGARRQLRILVPICLLVLGSLLTLRFIGAATAPFTYFSHHFPTHLRVDSLFFGVLLAYFYCFHRVRLRAFVKQQKLLLLSAGFLGLAIPFVWHLETTPFVYTIGFTLVALASGALVLVAVNQESKPGKIQIAAAFVGRHSYSIYLWHGVALYWVALPLGRSFGLQNNTLIATIYIVFAFAFGILASIGIEAPFLRLRDRLVPSNAMHRTRLIPATSSSETTPTTPNLSPDFSKTVK